MAPYRAIGIFLVYAWRSVPGDALTRVVQELCKYMIYCAIYYPFGGEMGTFYGKLRVTTSSMRKGIVSRTTDIECEPSTPAGDTLASAIRPVKKGEFVTRNIVGETILVPVRGRVGDLDAIYNLSEVASFIWARIDGQATLRQIVQGVCAEFDVAPETAESDALQFIAELERAGLVEPVSKRATHSMDRRRKSREPLRYATSALR